MKVCHLTSVHDRGDGRIFPKECVSLQKAGYDVSLIVADGKENEIMNGVKIYGVSGGTNRFTRMLRATKNVYKKAVELNADIYHLHDPELIPIGVKLKRRGKKVVFDSHEDVPQQILEKRWIPLFFRKIASSFYSWYERKSLRKFDGLISVNIKIVERLKKINNHTVMITNSPIIPDHKSNDSKYYKRTICFAGTINQDYNIHGILEAIKEIDDITFILAGHCADKYMETLTAMSSWSKVDYRGSVSFNEVCEIYNASTLGIAVHNYTHNSNWKEGGLGGVKFFEFMSFDLPVICTDFVVWERIIDEEKCGICVDPNNVDAIREAIVYLLDHPDVAQSMGKRGRVAVEKKYSWTTQEKILLNFYSQL